ncbi:hypothetical protein TRVL_05112 [Trypanosoma vivax]|nr:hypothetical protein TRVL_05112 [Trypanosoma vivax]
MPIWGFICSCISLGFHLEALWCTVTSRSAVPTPSSSAKVGICMYMSLPYPCCLCRASFERRNKNRQALLLSGTKLCHFGCTHQASVLYERSVPHSPQIVTGRTENKTISRN